MLNHVKIAIVSTFVAAAGFGMVACSDEEPEPSPTTDKVDQAKVEAEVSKACKADAISYLKLPENIDFYAIEVYPEDGGDYSLLGWYSWQGPSTPEDYHGEFVSREWYCYATHNPDGSWSASADHVEEK